MAVGDVFMFHGFLTPVLTQFSYQSHRLLFSHASAKARGEKYAGKKSRLNRGSNSQPPGHESDTFTTEPPGRGLCHWNAIVDLDIFKKNNPMIDALTQFNSTLLYFETLNCQRN